MNYYNEIDPFAAEWLRALIKEGLIPNGEVDTRSIADVSATDLRRFTQCHFFAGIGGWSHALALANWPDDRPIWTGSCPCQPFSVAGKGKGKADERHLWPVFHQLIAQCRPPVVMGEQVAGKAGYDWFDGVAADLEAEGYASRAVDIPACAVNAPHIRQRLYWCAVVNTDGAGQREHGGAVAVPAQQPSAQCSGGDAFDMADANGGGCARRQESQERRQEQGVAAERVGGSDMADADSERCDGINPLLREDARERREKENYEVAGYGFWDDTEWLTGADGKTRRAKPGVRLLVNGLPNRVGLLRGFGNAIVPPLAAEVIKAFMETDHV